MDERLLRSLIRDPSIRVVVKEETPSTNETVKQEAKNGAPEGLLVAARRQSAGKGRMGRSFFSPADTGLYMSLLLRPRRRIGGDSRGLSMQEVLALTPMAAVAGAEAIDEIRGGDEGTTPCSIKWVNDLFLDGKKTAGILAEGSMDPGDPGRMEYVVLGIGIDLVNPPGGFPEELRDIAGTVFGEKMPEEAAEKMAASFVKRYMKYYRLFLQSGERGYMETYRKRSNLIGKKVILLDSADHNPISDGSPEALLSGDAEQGTVTVTDIGPEGQLLVRRKDGTILEFTSGEVSVRLKE